MTRVQFRWAAAVTVALALPAVAVRAADPWWITHTQPNPAVSTAPAAALGRPVPMASLGRPVPVAEEGWNATPAAAVRGLTMPAGYDEAPGALLPPRVARGQPADPAPPALAGPPPTAVTGDGAYNAGVAVDQPLRRPFFSGCGEWFNTGTHPSTCGSDWFCSDPLCGDSLCSPVTNPFYFEDPRALSEIKPLFLIEKPQKSNGGGNAEFFGVQGRLALNQQWSIVVNKLGFVSLNPSTPIGPYHKSSGFAEVNVGPKWTFWRDENLKAAAATGLTFELPIGSKSVFQDTGTLGLVPYITYGQTFGFSSFGSFDFIGEAGYSFSLDNKRSDFFQSSLHLDYDIANWHKYYPLVELNYFHYTSLGKNTNLGFEGGDLVNFGSSTVNGRDLATIGPGFRWKVTPWAQIGTAVEFGLTKNKGLEETRFTLDVIFRY